MVTARLGVPSASGLQRWSDGRGFLVSILIFLLVACIVIWGARRLMAVWEIGEPIATTVLVVLTIIVAIALVLQAGTWCGAHVMGAVRRGRDAVEVRAHLERDCSDG